MSLWIAILACLLAALAGLSTAYKTALGKASAQLRAGMNQDEVAILFRDFSPTTLAPFDERPERMYAGTDRMWVFRKGVGHGTNVNYWPGPGAGDSIVWFERCQVYFDTNGTIVAYRYSRD